MKKRDFLKFTAGATLVAQLPFSRSAAAETAFDFSVRWLGAASMEIEIDGFRILTDPCFGEGPEAFIMGDPNEMFSLETGPNVKVHERLTPFPGLSAKGYDMVLLSHLHEDHFDQKAKAQIDRSANMVCAVHDAEKLAEEGFTAAPLPHGEALNIKTVNGELIITAAPAIHSPNQGISGVLGLGNGYWLQYRSGSFAKTLYWTGDTFLTAEVKEFLNAHGQPDILIPHIGNVGVTGPLGQISLNAQDALDFAHYSKTATLFPVHHSTYKLYLEPVSVLEGLYGQHSPDFALVVPVEGQAVFL